MNIRSIASIACGLMLVAGPASADRWQGSGGHNGRSGYGSDRGGQTYGRGGNDSHRGGYDADRGGRDGRYGDRDFDRREIHRENHPIVNRGCGPMPIQYRNDGPREIHRHSGHYEIQARSIWIEGLWQILPGNCGGFRRVWVPGRYEVVRSNVWVQDCCR